METLNIANLIDKNSITRLSNEYENKFLKKIQENFSDNQQQLFVASYYCFLNYDSKKDFVIDFDNVWKWLGFSRKDHGKTCLEKHFILDIDYKVEKAAPEVAGAGLDEKTFTVIGGAAFVKKNFSRDCGKSRNGKTIRKNHSNCKHIQEILFESKYKES